MQDAPISLAERRRLDELIGRALINDDLCRALLYQQSRRELLEVHASSFSQSTLKFLTSIADQSELSDLAEAIWHGLFRVGNGNGNGKH